MAAGAQLLALAKKNDLSAKYYRRFREFEWALGCGPALGVRRSCSRGSLIAALLATVVVVVAGGSAGGGGG